jgi:predicted DNA-binding protein with PD1-like motif
MDYRRFGDKIVARIDKGEEIIGQIVRICEDEGIKLANVSAIGAVSSANLGCFNTADKTYDAKDYNGVFEICNLSGTVSTMDGKTYVHTHAAIAGMDGHVFGGHLGRATVSATCEMVIDIIDGAADRRFSDEIGLNLFEF